MRKGIWEIYENVKLPHRVVIPEINGYMTEVRKKALDDLGIVYTSDTYDTSEFLAHIFGMNPCLRVSTDGFPKVGKLWSKVLHTLKVPNEDNSVSQQIVNSIQEGITLSKVVIEPLHSGISSYESLNVRSCWYGANGVDYTESFERFLYHDGMLVRGFLKDTDRIPVFRGLLLGNKDGFYYFNHYRSDLRDGMLWVKENCPVIRVEQVVMFLSEKFVYLPRVCTSRYGLPDVHFNSDPFVFGTPPHYEDYRDRNRWNYGDDEDEDEEYDHDEYEWFECGVDFVDTDMSVNRIEVRVNSDSIVHINGGYVPEGLIHGKAEDWYLTEENIPVHKDHTVEVDEKTYLDPKFENLYQTYSEMPRDGYGNGVYDIYDGSLLYRFGKVTGQLCTKNLVNGFDPMVYFQELGLDMTWSEVLRLKVEVDGVEREIDWQSLPYIQTGNNHVRVCLEGYFPDLAFQVVNDVQLYGYTVQVTKKKQKSLSKHMFNDFWEPFEEPKKPSHVVKISGHGVFAHLTSETFHNSFIQALEYRKKCMFDLKNYLAAEGVDAIVNTFSTIIRLNNDDYVMFKYQEVTEEIE